MQSLETQKLILNLERWRVSRNLSQCEMAKRLKISVSKYNKLVSGERGNVDLDLIKQIYLVTGKLCFQLMEYIDDDYLKLTDTISKLTHKEQLILLSLARDLIKLRE